METNGEKLLIKCDRLTLKLPEKVENADGTACAELLALRGQKFDQNRPLCSAIQSILNFLAMFDNLGQMNDPCQFSSGRIYKLSFCGPLKQNLIKKDLFYISIKQCIFL